MDEFLTVKEVQQFLKVSRTVIYKWLNEGSLKGYRVGGLVRFKKGDVENFIKEWRPK